MSNFQAEEWRVCVLDTNYEVSNLGNIRSLTRRVPMAHGATREIKGQPILPHVLSSTGYAQIHGSGRKKHSLHRMIALTFLDPVEGKNIVNHKNGVRHDNRLENLEWVTHSENLIHGFRMLGATRSAAGKFSKDHPTSKSVIATKIETGVETFFYCGSDAVREIGADSSCISRCCAGKIKSHKGYSWRFGAERNVDFGQGVVHEN